MTESNAGVELIRQERLRQQLVEGWTPEHDDEHADGDLALAAVAYATPEFARTFDTEGPSHALRHVPIEWPWGATWWKPTPNDRIRELAKAGALIAAEIDRLQRTAGRKP